MLERLRCGSGLTRADLTRATGLTAQSVSRLVDALHRRDLIVIGERQVNGRGQPSPELHINPEAAYGLGLSIMTDAVSASLMDLSGRTVAFVERGLVSPSRAAVLEQIVDIHDELLSTHVRDRRRIAGLGVSITGFFVGEGRQVNPPDPLGDFALVDIDEMIAARLNLPVWLDNDGSAAAIGEALAGVGRSLSTFAYIFFAMGVGGGVIIDGKLHRGRFGNAGEFAGILSPEHFHTRPTMEFLRQTLVEHGTPLRDIKDMVDRFDPCWPGVDVYIARVRPHLDAMISAISAVLDPEAIVLGGRIPKALAERLADELSFYSVPRRHTHKPNPAVLVSEVRGDCAAIGASAMPLKAQFFR